MSRPIHSDDPNLRRKLRLRDYAQQKDLKNHAGEDIEEYRREFFRMYGATCSCCGEKHLEFLTVEHLGIQRNAPSEGEAMAYRNAVREYRPELFRVVCWNCNCARGRYGYCPCGSRS